jgi:hypothetical protein
MGEVTVAGDSSVEAPSGWRGHARRVLSSRPFAAALVLNLALFLATYAAFTARFQANDDAMMMLAGAGVGRTVYASAYLGYTHVFIGWVLKQLYSLSLGVPWYALSLVSGLLMAHVVYLYVALRRHSLSGLAFYLLYFVLVGVRLLLGLQFTIVSTLLAVAGFLLVLEAGGDPSQDEGEHAPVSRVKLLLGVLLILWGSCMRFYGALLGFGVAAPLAALLLVRSWKTATPRSRAALGALGLAFPLCVVVFLASNATYASNPDTRDFLRRSGLASRVLNGAADTLVEPAEIKRRIEAVGWSQNDFLMLKTWFALDSEVYAGDRLEQLVSGLPVSNARLGLRELAGRAVKPLEHPLVTGCLLLLALGLVCFRFNPGGWWATGGVVAMVLVAIVYMVLFQKTPPRRAYFPLAAFLALLPLIGAPSLGPIDLARANLLRRATAAVLVVLALCLSGLALIRERERSAKFVSVQNLHRGALQALAPKRTQLYVVWAGAMFWEMLPPFADLSHLQTLVAPDAFPFPSTVETLRILGEGDLYQAIAQRDDVFLVLSRKHVGSRVLYQRYMREHYDLEVELKVVAENPLFFVFSGEVKAEEPGR